MGVLDMEYSNNDALSYKVMYDDVEEMINKLNNIGIDVSRYNKLIDNVDLKVRSDIDKRMDIRNDYFSSNTESAVNFGIESIYGSAIKELNNIKNYLNNYNFCFVIINTCNYIRDGIDKIDINELCLNAKGCLELLNNTKVIDYGDITNLMDELFDIVWLVIRKEMILNGYSVLLNYVMNNSNYVSILDDIIREYIKSNQLDSVDIIKNKCDSLMSKGLDSNYVDEDLIRLIVFIQNKEELLKVIINKFSELRENIYRNNKEIQSKDYDISTLEKDYKKREEKRKGILNLLARGIPLGLFSAFVINIGVKVGFEVIPKIATTSKYKTITTTYADGKEPVIEEDYTSCTIDDRVVIREHDSWNLGDNGYYWRNYNSYVYDSSMENIDIEYLLDMDLSNYSNFVKTVTEYSNDIVLNDNGDSKYREVIVTHQDLEDIEKSTSVFSIVVLEFLWLVVLFLGDCEYYMLRKDGFDLDGELIIAILDLIDDILNDIQIINNNIVAKKEIRNKINELGKLINSNEELRNIFNERYKEFVSKYGENEQIEKIYNNINNNSVDKDILAKVKYKRQK